MEHALVCVFFLLLLKNMHHSWRNKFLRNFSEYKLLRFFFKSKKKKNPEKQGIMQLTAIGQCALTFNSESMMN